MNIFNKKTLNIFWGILCALCLMGIPCNVYAAEAAPKNLSQVQQEAANNQQKTQQELDAVSQKIAQERQALRAEHARVAAAVQAQKSQAEALQLEFEALKEEENQLEEVLKDKQSMMSSIQSTISNNANLFVQGAPSYVAASLTEEQKALFKNLVGTKDFPKLSSIHELLTMGQMGISKSHIITHVDEKIFVRGGKEIDAKVLHLGAFQSFYQDAQGVGFALKTQLLQPLEIAPYVPSNTEQTHIINAFNGNYVLPVDISGGKLLMNPPKKHSLLSSIEESGIFGWCILLIGFLGTLLIIERAFFLARIKLNGKEVAQHVVDKNFSADDLQASPFGRVLGHMLYGYQAVDVKQDSSAKEAIVTAHDSQVFERRAEESMLKELPPLERFLHTIRIFAAVAPLLGLLGTVSGIVKTFRVITAHGSSDPQILSGGISEALLTTEMGLLVAIPLLLAHHFLSRRISNIMLDMELASTTLIRHLVKA